MTTRFDAYLTSLAARDAGLVTMAILAICVAASWWVVDRLHISDRWRRIIQDGLFGMVIILAAMTAILGMAAA